MSDAREEPGLHLEVHATKLIAGGGTSVRINGVDVTNATVSIRLEMKAGDITRAHMVFLVRQLDAEARALIEASDIEAEATSS